VTPSNLEERAGTPGALREEQLQRAIGRRAQQRHLHAGVTRVGTRAVVGRLMPGARARTRRTYKHDTTRTNFRPAFPSIPVRAASLALTLSKVSELAIIQRRAE